LACALSALNDLPRRHLFPRMPSPETQDPEDSPVVPEVERSDESQRVDPRRMRDQAAVIARVAQAAVSMVHRWIAGRLKLPPAASTERGRMAAVEPHSVVELGEFDAESAQPASPTRLMVAKRQESEKWRESATRSRIQARCSRQALTSALTSASSGPRRSMPWPALLLRSVRSSRHRNPRRLTFPPQS
jgi:hypothetical protein